MTFAGFALARLAAPVLRAAAAPPEGLRPPPQTTGEIRRHAKEILSRPEFQEPGKTLYERAVDFVSKQIDRVLSSLIGGGRGSVLGWLILAAFVALVAYLITRVYRTTSIGSAPAPEPAAEIEGRRPAADWRAEAAAHETRGEWRAALRCRYRALVADLAHRGVVEEVPGRTAGEYRREVAGAAPAAAPEFATATAMFEGAWYGNRPTDREDATRFRDLSDRVLERAGR